MPDRNDQRSQLHRDAIPKETKTQLSTTIIHGHEPRVHDSTKLHFTTCRMCPCPIARGLRNGTTSYPWYYWPRANDESNLEFGQIVPVLACLITKYAEDIPKFVSNLV